MPQSRVGLLDLNSARALLLGLWGSGHGGSGRVDALAVNLEYYGAGTEIVAGYVASDGAAICSASELEFKHLDAQFAASWLGQRSVVIILGYDGLGDASVFENPR